MPEGDTTLCNLVAEYNTLYWSDFEKSASLTHQEKLEFKPEGLKVFKHLPSPFFTDDSIQLEFMLAYLASIVSYDHFGEIFLMLHVQEFV